MATTVYASQDVYVDVDGPGDNFEGYNLAVCGDIARMYTYIEFDVSSLVGKDITEAMISLYIISNRLSSSTRIRFYRISESWDAGEITYNTRPDVTSTSAKNKLLETSDINWESWNITDLVNDIISYGGYGIRVEIDADAVVQFNSTERGNAPKLRITEAAVSTPPVINSIAWSPKGTISYVGVGATYYGRSGTALKVTRVSAGTTSIRIGAITYTYARGDTFTLDDEGYTLLHVLDDGECAAVVIARNISTNQHPAIGEEVSLSANVTWNDDGATATTRRVEWFYLKPTSETYTKAYADDINNWTHFETGHIVNHTFTDGDDSDIIYLKVIARNQANLTDEFGVGTCSSGQFNVWQVGDGFEITVVDGRGSDKLTIAEAELIPDTNAWIVKPFLLPFGVGVMQWLDVVNGDYLGISDPTADPLFICGQCDPAPSFCNLHLVAGKHYAVFRSTSGISVIDGGYVHELKSGRNAVTVDRSLLSGLETTICGILGISGDECTSLIAEMNDVVFVGNYYSIMTSGSDMFGNTRELTWFDHIALPFALIGVIAPELPFGRFVSDGLRGVWKGGKAFSSAASDWMRTVQIAAPGEKIVSAGPWTFMQSIVRISADHLDEVMGLIHDGNYALAKSRLEQYLASDLGNVPYRAYRDFNDAMREYLPIDKWEALMNTIYGFPPQADSIIKTASKSSLTPDDIADIADAAGKPKIIDEVTEAVYESLIDMEGASATKVQELANILRNSTEISTRVGAKNVPMQHLVDLTDDIYDLINTQLGASEANRWFKNNGKITKSALDSASPEAMADIPYASQKYAASYEDVANSAGGKIADDVIKATDNIVTQPINNWRATAKQSTKSTSDKFWDYYSGLSDAGKENIVHIMIGATLVFSAVVLYKIYTDAGEQSLNHNLFAKKMDTWYWPCHNACAEENADDLEAAIKIYEKVINECAESLETYKDTITADGLYDEFYRTLELHRLNLSRMKRCLEALAPCGNIHCTSNTNFFYVDLDGEPAGFSFANHEVLLKTIRVGSHTVKIHKHSWTPECTEEITVTEGTTKESNCEMTEEGGCSPITNVKIYISPLSPSTGETVSLDGSANSGDTITKWEWDFDDGYTDTGQAVTHSFRSAGVYTVRLNVTNSCGISEFTTRNVNIVDDEDTGTIRCTSNQSSFETFIDDVSVGPSYGTKLKVVSGVPVGSHSVRIEKGPGYTPESCTETIRVYKDETSSMDCQMELVVVDVATLTIQQVHGTDGKVIPGAWTIEIWVDGLYTKCQGAQTLTFGDGLKCDCSSPYTTPCELGTHTITLKKAGYKDISAEVTLVKGDTKTWYSPVMEEGSTPPPRTVSMVVPVGSTLYIDGTVHSA